MTPDIERAIRFALTIIERDDKDNAGPSRILRPGTTDEYRLAQAVLRYAYACREATSIGIANLFSYCGAYESLSSYKKQQWDRLNELAVICDGLPDAPTMIEGWEKQNAVAPQAEQNINSAPSQEGHATGPAEAAAPEITDEQGRPMTYWGGLKVPPAEDALELPEEPHIVTHLREQHPSKLIEWETQVVEYTDALRRVAGKAEAEIERLRAERERGQVVINAARALSDWLLARAGQPSESFALRQAIKQYDAALAAQGEPRDADNVNMPFSGSIERKD